MPKIFMTKQKREEIRRENQRLRRIELEKQHAELVKNRYRQNRSSQGEEIK